MAAIETERLPAMTRALAWGFWLVSVTLLAVALVLLIVADASAMTTELGWLPSVATLVFVLAFATVGALIGVARPRNPVGWILSSAGLCFSLGGFSIAAGTLDLPGSTILEWLSGWIWGLGVGLAGTFLLLLFPHGRLPSPRWRPVAWFAATAIVAVTVPVWFPPFSEAEAANPLGVAISPTVLRAVGLAGVMAMVVSVALSIASVAVRFRRSRGVERQQMKWLVSSAAVVAVALGAGGLIEVAFRDDETVLNVSNALIAGSLSTVPLAAGMAILRHRLYEIDRIISRTVAWAALTGLLVAVYLAMVALLQRLLAPLTGESDLAVAGSTLAVAALFTPLRRRVQSVVDRRFHRVAYDAERIVAAFRSRLRDSVDLDTVSDDLIRTVGATVQPATTSLWRRATPR